MPGHPGAFRGICKSFLVVALCRSFPLLVTAMVGTATLKRSHRLRTQPIMNRPRTLRRGESNTTRSYVLDMRRTSLTSSLTTCDLVSQSTHIPTAQTPVMDVENSCEEASDNRGNHERHSP